MRKQTESKNSMDCFFRERSHHPVMAESLANSRRQLDHALLDFIIDFVRDGFMMFHASAPTLLEVKQALLLQIALS